VSWNELCRRVGWLGFLGATATSAVLLTPRTAAAQAQPIVTAPSRSQGWKDATNVMALSAAGLQLLTPRVFYADPEVTLGWKARFHLSVLAPSMTLIGLALTNEVLLKDSFEGNRPGCDEATQGFAECSSYGMLSTQSFLAFSSFGQGLGVFLIDTTKWSGGRLNVGTLTTNVVLPGVLSVLTAVGRTSGNWETGGQVWASAGTGALLGFGLGMLYATLQRPECGYGGDLICW
jgi:hypothetical protein